VTDPPDGRNQPRTPGDRRLAHPPSDRYRVPEDVAPAVDGSASATRGIAYAVLAGLAGTVATIGLGGVLAVSAGLVMVAAATGWAVAIGLRSGAGRDLAPARRMRLALALTSVAIGLGQVGLWVYARSEGGVLGPLDYLGETFGLLVPLQLVIAWVSAWATAR
jgi:hypothetical protein